MMIIIMSNPGSFYFNNSLLKMFNFDYYLEYILQ
jgi:hypothetical protein